MIAGEGWTLAAGGVEVEEGEAEPERRRFWGFDAGVIEQSALTDCSNERLERVLKAILYQVYWLLMNMEKSISHTKSSSPHTKMAGQLPQTALRAHAIFSIN